MAGKMNEDRALFAPDYDGTVDQGLVDAALLRIEPAVAAAILASGDDGSLPTDIGRVHLRSMILHGLAEIFERNLTPLGMAVKMRLNGQETVS